MKKIRMLVALNFFLFTSWTQASVIYDESVSGDLAAFDTINFNLTSGINSVLGSSAYDDFTADFDGFNLSLGDGLRLNSINYLISNVSVSSSTDFLETDYVLTNGSRLLDDTSRINVLGSSQQSMFSGTLPLIGGQGLSFDQVLLARSGEGGTWDYEIRFTVSPVPEPTMLTLMLMGLGLLGFYLVGTKKINAGGSRGL